MLLLSAFVKSENQNGHKMKGLREMFDLNRQDHNQSCKDGRLSDVCSTGASTNDRQTFLNPQTLKAHLVLYPSCNSKAHAHREE